MVGVTQRQDNIFFPNELRVTTTVRKYPFNFFRLFLKFHGSLLSSIEHIFSFHMQVTFQLFPSFIQHSQLIA